MGQARLDLLHPAFMAHDCIAYVNRSLAEPAPSTRYMY